jgi:N-acetyl-beta-hexosaminidase
LLLNGPLKPICRRFRDGYLKKILSEICTAYDVPYLHIGADEVKIINKNFIPEMTAYTTKCPAKKLLDGSRAAILPQYHPPVVDG